MWLNVQVEHCSFGLCELIYHRHNCDIDLIRVNLVLFWWKTDFFLSLKGACYCSSQLMYYWSWWIRNCCDALDLIYQIVCYSHHPTQSPWWYSMCAPQIQRVLTMCSILVTFEFSTTKIALLWIKSVVSISLGFFLIQRYNIRKYWHVMMLCFSLKSKECNKSLVFLIKRCKILLGGGVGILPFHEFSHLFLITADRMIFCFSMYFFHLIFCILKYNTHMFAPSFIW